MPIIKKDSVKAVILVGDRDFGRCPLASKLPYALWPLNGKPAISYLLKNLAENNIMNVKICGGNNTNELMHSLNPPSEMSVEFIYEELPLGTAGCIRESINHEDKCTLFVMSSNIVSDVKFEKLLDSHHKNNSPMTVFCAFDTDGSQSTEIYVCDSSVVELIPQERYFDIKEELIPAMQRAGQLPCFEQLNGHLLHFGDSNSYIKTQISLMSKLAKNNVSFWHWQGQNDIAISSEAKIAVDAKIYGHVVIGKQTQVESGAIIIGPTYIGEDNHIHRNSIVNNCVIWNNTKIGSDCELRNCVVESSAKISSGCKYKGNCITSDQLHVVNATRSRVSACCDQAFRISKRLAISSLATLENKVYPLIITAGSSSKGYIASALIIVALFLWSYFPEIGELTGLWLRNNDYSSGILVPFVALYVLWINRQKLLECPVKPSLWGLGVLLGAQGMRHFGLYYMYSSAERYSLVITLIGIMLIVFGWQMLKRTAPVLLFLFLMLPLPHIVDNSLSLPLQSLATKIAVGLLELTGFAVVRQGNLINVGDVTVAIAEACNGLRMITAFVTICAMVVIISKRSLWEKSVIFLSSIPIAVFCNSLRLTVTALVFSVFTQPNIRIAFHDFGGYAMMPIAIAIVFFELWILSKFTDKTEKKVKTAV